MLQDGHENSEDQRLFKMLVEGDNDKEADSVPTTTGKKDANVTEPSKLGTGEPMECEEKSATIITTTTTTTTEVTSARVQLDSIHAPGEHKGPLLMEDYFSVEVEVDVQKGGDEPFTPIPVGSSLPAALPLSQFLPAPAASSTPAPIPMMHQDDDGYVMVGADEAAAPGVLSCSAENVEGEQHPTAAQQEAQEVPATVEENPLASAAATTFPIGGVEHN